MGLSRIFKITVVILILGAGLAGSYFIVKNSANGSASISVNSLDKKINQGLQEIKDQFDKGPFLEPEQPIQWSENNNLTQNIGQKVFEQIQATDFSNQTSANLSDNFDLATDFNLVSDINDSELKISQDNSKEAKKKYLSGVREINERDLSSVDKSYAEVVVDVFKNLDVASASHLAEIYKNLANDYSGLTIPSDWFDIHKAMIIHLRNSEIVFSAMANYLKDPVKGYTASELLGGLLDNAKRIQLLFNEKVKEIE